MSEQINLINHSSVLIKTVQNINLLTDPWYDESAFNNGWSLLYINRKDEIEKILNNLKFIFISHEHPDHFSIKFFKDYGNLIKENNIKIIFQHTLDKRVENFIKKIGLDMIILQDRKKYKINDEINITIFKQGHIDSAFLYETKEFYHLNINDCNFINSELLEIANFIKSKKKKIIIYIQFSYASFRANDEWLKKAAQYKLDNILKISKMFNPSLVLPFASFFYFCHSENKDLNKFVNKCSVVSKFLDKNKIKHCFLSPKTECINLNDIIENDFKRNEVNKSSINFWDERKSNLKIIYFEKESGPILKDNIIKFINRLKKKNNIFLLHLIRLITFKAVFGDLLIKINVTDKIYLLNFFYVKELENSKKKADISMSAEQFNLLLSQPYGIESLLVSGRLKVVNKFGLRKLTSSIGITTINLANYGITFKDIFNKLILNKIIGLIYRAIMQKS